MFIAKFTFRSQRDVERTAQRTKLLGSLVGLCAERRANFCQSAGDVVRFFFDEGWRGALRFEAVRRESTDFVEAVIYGSKSCRSELHDRLLTAAGADEHDQQAALHGARQRVDRFAIEHDDRKGPLVRLAMALPAGANPVSEDIAREWGVLLADEAALAALVKSHEHVQQLSEGLSVAQRRDADREIELRQLKSANETLELLALVASKTDHAVIIMDAEGRIDWVNDAFSRISGHEAVAVGGKTLADLLHGPLTDPDAVRELHQALQAGHALGQEVLHYRSDGRTYWAWLSITPVPNDDGRPKRWIGMASDISRRRQVQEELRNAREAAEAANRAKSEFLANMSHEIRTPMNAVLGMTELALGTELSAEQREYLAAARESAESLLALLNDILDLSKIEAGKLEIEGVPFPLRQLLRDMLKGLALRAKQKGLQLDWTVQADVEDALLGDPLRLRQVLVNLVGNAVKFTLRGQVDINVESQWRSDDETCLHFAVQDTGIGIPSDKLQRVFQAFTQADSSISRLFGGTGLGLTISSQLIELMGGRIWVQTKVGAGSTFHFTVRFRIAPRPATGAAPAEAGSRELPTAETAVAGKGGLRLLVADDNPANRLLATRLLEKRGHRVLAVENGSAVLAALERNRFDAVLMDVQMPDMDGFAATAAIRAREQQTGTHLPIVAMTAYAMQGDRERCVAAGMDAYLPKPIRATELYDLVENLAPAPQRQPPISEVDGESLPSHDGKFDAALARVEGDVEILKEQMAFFLHDSPVLMSQARSAIVGCDARALQLAAHRLKGMASGFDDPSVTDPAARLELHGRGEEFGPAQAVCDELEAQLSRLTAAVQDFVVTH